ncbi:unnamed protein product [Effrenium voratum]|uniref:Alpha-amylase n=1 Tax=Effrenium voratum TaxID=2562239 RepID=A0AA36IEX5_9DINO|nr:unnamed protein product [Effrenium voratum]
MRNFLVALFLSAGAPMILYGDEYGRSQRGCNNGWCQDARCWFSWSDSEKEENGLMRSVRLLISLRKQYAGIFNREESMSNKDTDIRRAFGGECTGMTFTSVIQLHLLRPSRPPCHRARLRRVAGGVQCGPRGAQLPLYQKSRGMPSST